MESKPESYRDYLIIDPQRPEDSFKLPSFEEEVDEAKRKKEDQQKEAEKKMEEANIEKAKKEIFLLKEEIRPTTIEGFQRQV